MIVMVSAPTQVSRQRIVLLGSTGQLGATLKPVLSAIGEVIATDRAVLDLKNSNGLRELVSSYKPALIVNAAAYTAVDKAETDRDVVWAVNATAPGALAQAARDNDALLIHYSTDYVFDGSKASPYVESDPINPLNVYGRTKVEGELAIRN